MSLYKRLHEVRTPQGTTSRDPCSTNCARRSTTISSKSWGRSCDVVGPPRPVEEVGELDGSDHAQRPYAPLSIILLRESDGASKLWLWPTTRCTPCARAAAFIAGILRG